jgi:two-component system, chemotaxis family, chemotaxis protein CheY
MMRVILRRALEQRDFEVLEAANGIEALAQLAREPVPALALVDWKMPEMDGVALVRQLRQERMYDAMAIIMVTSETEPAQIEHALAAGADEYVTKPLTADILRTKLVLIEQESVP